MTDRFPQQDQRCMAEALRLALTGAGRVHPNPLVGAVIARGGRIVGRGAHRAFGGPHAEVHAAADAGRKASGATLYVTLEPCPHTGKTPPCTDLILRSGIRRVVVGCQDPDPRVRGAGVRALRRAGVRVEVGCLETLCASMNRDFFHWVRTRRPYVTLKFAQSLDGRIATRTGASRWISGAASRGLVQRLRAASDAVLIGVGTLLQDDPLLSVRGAAVQPLKVILDGRLRTPERSRIFSDRSPGQVLIATTKAAPASRERRLKRRGAQVWRLRSTSDGRVDLGHLLRELGRHGIVRVLAEGGGETIASFLEARLAQELYCFQAPIFIGGSASVPSVGGRGVATLSQAPALRGWTASRCGEDLLIHGEF